MYTPSGLTENCGAYLDSVVVHHTCSGQCPLGRSDVLASAEHAGKCPLSLKGPTHTRHRPGTEQPDVHEEHQIPRVSVLGSHA